MTVSQDRLLAALRESVKETERLRRRNAELTTPEPIAVVGMACRFPGGVTSPEELWRLLSDGADAISDFPDDRGWALDTPDDTDRGASYTRHGGFLYEAAEFDAGFFGISPREALGMDPQQRLLLETAWEALERSGIDPNALKGSKTGVFVGGAVSGYDTVGDVSGDAEGYTLIGGASSVLSGRIAYTLGLEGPAVTVDTACSSSLVALHLAAQALRSGECSMALAGGVAVMATAGIFGGFASYGGLAGDGRCKAFSASADGTGWGEGAGLLVVERLSDARRNGHRVLAVVRGSAINQDGASNGLTAPNGPAQQRVIRQALASAGVAAAEVDVVEAHGTGTRLGDPIEAQALLATYGQDRPADRPLWLGSVKSNIGHTLAAAGVAGVIKMVLAMQHGQLPPTLHVDEPTPEVDWSAGAVELLTEQRPWPVVDRPWRAGVSSFGVSGTNAHVILEQAPESTPLADVDVVAPVVSSSVVPWVVSGRSESALREQARRLAAYVEADARLDLVGVGAALVSTRASLEYRAVVLGADRDELIARLAGLAAGEPGAGVVSGVADRGAAGGRGVVFVFPGQGAQWVGMAQELLAASPVFADRMGECAQALAPFVEWDLLEVLGDQAALGRVDVVQPVLWAVMVSLAHLWQSLGVTPSAVLGHSQGEIAAACVAGGLSLDDAARISAVRSRMIAGSLAGRGGMVSVGLPLAGVESLVARWEGRLSVAAVNGPSSVVVSGDAEAVAELVAAGKAEDFRARRVEVDYASHSPHVEQIEAELIEALAGITPTESTVAFYSTVTGELIDTRELDAQYWFRNLRETVRLADTTRALAEAGHGTFVEVSPHPVLTPSLEETLFESHPAAVVTGTLRRGEDESEQLLAAVARLHVRGVPVDMSAVLGRGSVIDLPTYAFQRERYWPEAVSGPAGVDDELWSVVRESDAEALSAELGVDERAVAEVVPALAAWRERRRARSAVVGWRFEESWKLLPGMNGAVLPGSWLVVVPAGAAQDAWVASVVEALGDGVVRLEVDGGVDRAALAGLPELTGVVSLLGLAEGACVEFAATPVGLAGTVGLVRALGDVGVAAPVWCVTRGAVSVGSGDLLVSPVQSALWGLGRSAALDLPARWGGLVDLPAVLDGQTGGLLRRVLTGDEDQVAVRESGVYGRRLVPAGGSGAGAEARLRGSVLITGGTGGLGGHVARWAVARGAEHVVLVSRRGLDAPGVSALCEELGARVMVEACDVADREALAGVLARIPADCPLTAVVHAAGIGDDHAPVEELEPGRLDAVLRAKMASAWHLHELTAGLDLDAFVLFSSGAASWGAGGQAAYAAANASLDGLAGYRHAQGLSATSVAWGLWAGPGMGAADAEVVEGYRRRGVLPMEPELAMAALERAVCEKAVTLTVTNTDWERFAPSFTVERPSALLSGIPEARKALTHPGTQPAGESVLRRKLAGLGEKDRARALLDLVRREAAVTLGFDNADALPPNRAFRDIGFDSLTAVELRNKLATATGLVLPASLVFDYPTPTALAEHLETVLLGSEAQMVAPVLVKAEPDEPIAIVGMGCRFPGGVSSPEQLWDVVASSVDALGEFPGDRGWDLPGDDFARLGGFVEDVAGFDAGFFGISPREALGMDPQQRLLLETAWEALERSGIDPNALKGSKTGVFVGGTVSGYDTVGDVSGDAEGYMLTGGASSVLSGRIAYTLGLEGPAVTVDTACSSSLVALHLAAQALRSGECSMALVGGVTVMVTPRGFAEFAAQGGLAGDGRCKAFAGSADGTGWGEGAGLVVVERLSDAQRNGHRVLAVVRGSAVNQDGASNGLSAPNGPSQQRVILQALASAGVAAAEVDVVEAHGTGTRLGDPIEAQALLATYGQDRLEGRPLWLGSLKSNIGHTQAAAGVAGVIKMVLAMQRGVLPRTLHVDEPTPEVDWAAGAVELLTEQQPWPEVDRPRRAGVSAFGVSGTNAHVILEQAPESTPVSGADVAAPSVVPWVVSGGSESALWEQARRLAAHVEAAPELDPVAVGAALVSTRASLEHRAVVLGTDRDQLTQGLRKLASGEPGVGVVTGVAGQGGRMAFLFTGQGAQRAGMGRELAEAFPVFADAFEEVCEGFAGLLPGSLKDVVFSGEGLDRTEWTQPGLFAFEVALFRLLGSWGVAPDYVAGHSIGELTAAHVAGVLSLPDACQVVAARAGLMQALPAEGAMLAVEASEAEIAGAADEIAGWGEKATVAAVNAARSVVLSGDAAVVAAMGDLWRERGRKVRRLRVSHAFHSPLMDPMLDPFAEVLGRVEFGSPSLGMTVPAAEVCSVEYWVRQVREPVRFADMLAGLSAQGVTRFVEIGPDGVLTGLGSGAVDGVFVAAQRRDRPEVHTAMTALSTLHTHGVPVDWSAIVGRNATIDLPTYAFQHERYWPEAVSGPAGVDDELWSVVRESDAEALSAELGVDERAVAEVVPALAAWRERRRARSAVVGWRFEESWKLLPGMNGAVLPGSWLVVVPAGAAQDAWVASVVEALGDGVVRLEVDGGVDRAALAGLPELTGVLSLLGLVEGACQEFAATPVGLAGTVGLVRALGDVGVAAPVWCVTRGAVSVGSGDALVSPVQSALWGLGRSAALDLPARWGGLVDLPAVLDGQTGGLLRRVLTGDEDQVAVRESGVYGRRLVRAGAGAGHAEVRLRGSVLITGGTGGLGGHVARWAVARGAEHVVLVSRRGLDAPGVSALCEELGARVSVEACDVADREALAGVLARIPADCPLTAVVHAAGIGDDHASVEELEPGRLDAVLRAKMVSAWHLHELTAGLDLDAFVLFSSGAASWGAGGQAAYAAANAFLDGLAGYRRGAGLAATSVAWGVWAGPGMGAAGAEFMEGYRRRGVLPMEPELAMAALERAVCDGSATLTVTNTDWERFAPSFTVERPSALLSGIPEARKALAGPSGRPAGESALRRKLAGMGQKDRARALLDLVRREAAVTLGFDNADALPQGRAFRDAGFGSLTAVELRNKLATATGLVLPASLVFDYPTPTALAEHLESELLGTVEAVQVTPVTTTAVDEPIAIVGMGCRFPGGVESPEQLWTLLSGGVDAISEFPTQRGWDVTGDGFARVGGFIEDAAGFDAGFFGISPREALAMDPQQRLLLETAWEALERSGIDPHVLKGSKTGVFVGGTGSGYDTVGATSGDAEGYMLTGGASSVLSGRIAYTLGLEGPAITVDTACSSSLVALHLAAQALRSGECTMALAGGVAVMATPGIFAEFAAQGGLAADGRCKAFAASADGTGWGEGAGLLVVERLSDARRNGHQVLAVVRGSAVNQDGASNGLSAPNGPSQQRVIVQALANAGVAPAEVDVVEAHGTGTRLGDPIEAQALLATYGQDRPEDRPLWLGSVKSNIGHTLAAAGAAGVIKMVLAMRHGQLPPTLHVDQPTPELDWSAGAVELLTEQQPWPVVDRPWRAGVSSFGISGTNAHVILEQAPESTQLSDADVVAPPVVPWVLSARSESALREQARRLAAHVEAAPELDPVDVGAALVSTRANLEHRAVVLGADRDELIARLAGLAAGEPGAGVVTGRSGADERGVVFVFPGQGSQWVGMAQELLVSSQVFAERMGECAQALAPFVEWDLLEVLGDQAALERVDVVQPVLWAVMVSLAAVWQSLGVTPSAVLGHSQGEIAAACVAGGLSLEDAARISAVRSRMIAGSLAGRGGMVSVGLPLAGVESLLARWEGRLSVAAVNGPSSVVVSGDAEAVAELVVAGRAEGFRARRVEVDYASHSPHVEEIEAELIEALAGITPLESTVAFYSTVTGELTDTRELDAQYWYRNLRETVRLADTTRALASAGHGTFVEVSPHPVLTPSLDETLFESHPAAVVTGTLRRGENESEQLLTAVARLHTHGVPVDWSAIVGRNATIDLPTYAFQRERYWPSPRAVAGDARGMGLMSVGHPLLGAAVELAGGEGVVFTSRLSLASHAWLADHTARGVVLLAGTAFVELVVRAGDEVGCGVLEDLVLERPLVLPERGAIQVQVVVEAPEESGRRAVSVYSRPEEETDWARHASGTLASEASVPVWQEVVWPPADAIKVPVEGLYEGLAETGYGYGPAFQGLRAAWRRGEEVFAEVRLPDEVAERAGEFGIHPALFDAALHAAAYLPGESEGGLPFSWSGVSLHASGARSLRVRLSVTVDGALCLNAADDTGTPVVSVDSLVVRPAQQGQLSSSGSGQDNLFSVDWVLKPVVPVGDVPRCVVAGVGGQGLAKVLGVAWHRELSECPEADLVLLPAGAEAIGTDDGDVAAAARVEVSRVLELVQEWLASDERADARLVVVTRNAVSTGSSDRVEDVVGAGVQGLVRSARSEHPGRFGLVDVDGSAESWQCLPTVLATGDEGDFEFAVRAGQAYCPRLAPARTREVLTAPAGVEAWRLGLAGQGSVDDLALVPSPEAEVALEAGQVRIAVRAAGLNFRDVLNVLGMYPGESFALGAEVAGVVVETGPGVSSIAVGDRVMAMAVGGFGPVVVADVRLVARIPQGWSFAQAAGVPVAFLTALYGLRETGGLEAGQRVLVHAAAGGVGMAAVQLARLWGAEVFATASPGKQDTVHGLGVARDHIASSRTTDFADRFTGMDVVLNSLAGEFVDASLATLREGGRFVELGKTDLRDAAEIAAQYPQVSYQAIDLEIDLDVVGGMLADLAELFEAGALSPLPTRTWDVRQGRDAFRYMAQARHVGKIVLTLPRTLDPDGTVLITGGTGGLGGLLARHLVDHHGIRHLTLVSRQGPSAPGAQELVEELTGLGAHVQAVACDVSDRDAVTDLIAGVPEQHPLTAVIHAAAVLDDGMITSLTPQRVDTVMRPKADAAWYLREATAGLDLDAFILFSSVSGVFGGAGVAAYAAANSVLDAMAQQRAALGEPVVALAWGLWADAGGMMGRLGHTDLARFGRAGVRAMSEAEALALFDLAIRRPEAHLAPVGLDLPRHGGPEQVLPLLRGLVSAGGPARPVARAAVQDSSGLAGRLATLTTADQQQLLLDLVRGHVAPVLGHASAQDIDPEKAFRDMGFDSLTTVELRNRLATATGLRLPATLAFDHPTVSRLADYLRQRLTDTVETASVTTVTTAAVDEPIAIVGMGCRYPGGVESPEQLWTLLTAGVDAISAFPTQRGWDLSGDAFTQMGGFLHEAAEFDAGFFGISPREALAMDPQQRLLLETAWEALERSGIDPNTLKGSKTGVFLGGTGSGYDTVGDASGDAEGYMLTGGASSVLSGRIAYVLGLEGPAVTVDTACSSSLAALHLATQALRSGECDLALAGGVTVMATPGVFAGFAIQGGLASDGRCKAFSGTADGVGLAEGAGLLAVERLSDARRNGHQVLAVVRGTAMNQDGASNGLTAPNGPSQQRVIRQALASAGVAAAEVDVVEAHGTGTRLGDPIEAQALLATYGQDRPADRPLLLGSLKSNIGHTQAAAGVAGVMKMVLAMRHGQLPPTLHVDQPTPEVDWSVGAVELLTEQRSWPVVDRPWRAGVSSFGISGTNAHVILEQASESTRVSGADVVAPSVVPWVVSARSESALREQARRLAVHVEADSGLDPVGVGAALVSTRASFGHRAVVLGTGRDELLEGLAGLAEGVPGVGVVAGVAGQGGRTAFLFTGQGAQRAGMGRELAEAFPVFADAFEEVCAGFAGLLPGSLKDVVFGGEGLDRTEWTQPGLFAFEVALFRLLGSWGVTADYVAGHSIGELTAAYVAGVLSLPDACRVVAARAGLMQALSAEGAMLAVEASEAEIAGAAGEVAGWGEKATIAAVNAARSVVLSGDAGVVGAMGELWRGRGRKVRRLRVSHAFHSPLMDPMLDPFAEVLGRVEFGSPSLGMTVPAAEVCSVGYWVRQVREPVRFADMLAGLSAQGVTRFVEIGPDGVLTGLGSGAVDGVFVATQRRDRPEAHAAMTALSTLHTHGVPVDWSAIVGRNSTIDLPTYAFQRERYWPRPRAVAGDVRGAGLTSLGHPLLGAAVELAGGEGVVFTSRLSLASHAWLADHAVRGVVLLAGTAFVELLVRAGDEVGCGVLEDLTLERPLVLPERGAVQVQVVVDAPEESGRRAVSVYSRPEEETDWIRHASGTLSASDAPVPVWQETAWPPPGAEPVPVDGLYDGLAEAGYGYGPSFQGLRAVWRRGEEVFAEVRLPDESAERAGQFGIHPALFDAALHAATFLPGDVEGGLPFAWNGASLHASGARSLRVRLSVIGDGTLCLKAVDDIGTPVVSVDSLTLRSVRTELLESGIEQRSLFSVDWVLKPVVPVGDVPRCVVAGVGGQGLAKVLGVAWHRELSECPEADLVLLPAGADATGTDDGDVAAAARVEVSRVLELVQEWLDSDERADARLVVVTRNAVSTGSADRVEDVAGAGVQGLVRSARSEHPGRFGLVDVDGSAESWQCLPTVLATGDEDDFELAVRAGQAYSPRLTPASVGESSAPSVEARPVDPEGTVLITGGTGTLGGLVARDWVERHGVRHLLLVSRQGPSAPGSQELVDELTRLGAQVWVMACDVSDRAALTAVLDAIPDEHRLTAVVHTAGVVDDGMVTSLTPERVEAVMRPKADAAWYLHEATAGLDLAAFVLFSSLSGVLGAAGQAGYAAANSVLDAIAQQRAADGESAVSVAWGMWAPTSALTGQLSETDRLRIGATGVVPLTAEEGTALLDRAVRSGRSFVAGLRWDPAGVRAGQPVSGLLRGLVRGPVRRRSLAAVRDGEAAGTALRQRLAGLSATEAQAVLAQVVTTHTATVLGHATPESIQAASAFQELGFDSMTAVDLRNRLNTVTGLRLPATLVFDYPTPEAVADHLRSELRPDTLVAEPSEDADVRLGETLAAIPVSRLRKAGLLDLLLQLAGEDGEAAQTTTSGDEVSIDELDGESLLRLAAENTTN